MKKLNKYDLTDSELKRAYNFINAAYLKRNYDSQSSEAYIPQNKTPKKAIIIKNDTSKNKNIKQDLQSTPKKKVVSQVIQQEPVENKTLPVKTTEQETKPLRKKDLSFRVRLLVEDKKTNNIVPLYNYIKKINFYGYAEVIMDYDPNLYDQINFTKDFEIKNIQLTEDSIIKIVKKNFDNSKNIKAIASLKTFVVADPKTNKLIYQTDTDREPIEFNDQTPEIIDIILKKD